MPVQDFIDSIAKAGIPATHNLILDGKLRRYRVNGDKKGRKNGWYRYVEVTHEYAWGVFGCNKRGISEKWSSKDAKSVTSYEKKEWRKLEKQFKLAEEELQARAAIKANNIWNSLQPATIHPYGDRKGIALYGVRQLNNALVIPLYIENYLVSLQFIFADGHKRFLTGGQMAGAYYWIGTETDVIYICEGYATAASVHEATGKHVVIAFNAGNIPAVAHMVRERNKDKKIIIAADNDQWTAGNPGLSKAQEAAALVGTTKIFPKFNYEDPARPTDWNDYHQRFGLAALAVELLGINNPVAAVVAADEAKWHEFLIEGKATCPGIRKDFDAKSKDNAYSFLAYHPMFRDMVAFNTFSSRLVMTRAAPWDIAVGFTPRPLDNRDYFNATRALERLGIRTSKDVVQDAWEAIGETRTINPPRDYIDSIPWDRVPRIDRWLTYYLGAEGQDAEYLKLIGSKWLMGAVSRIYNPGEKFDNVLILEGGQDNKKSMLFEKITTFGEEPYFLEFSGDITKADSLGMMQGKIIVEMSELASMRKAATEEMKTFVTRRKDTFRPAWGKTLLERKRVFVLAATTNNEAMDGYLVDPTGNRRYWPVKCGMIDMDRLVIDKDQLWAEALYRWKGGERTWLDSDEERELAKFEQSERQYEDAWLEPINFFLIERMETDVYEICSKSQLGLSGDKIRKNEQDRIHSCLKKLGWERNPTRPRGEKGRITKWIRKI